MVTGSLFDLCKDEGARLAVPLRVHFNTVCPCQGASLMMCHIQRPSTQVFIMFLPTEPAARVETTMEISDSEAGM